MVALNTADGGIPTSADYIDPSSNAGDTGSHWVHWQRLVDGAHEAFGKKADAAVTNPATAATFMSNFRGLLTNVQSLIAGIGATTDAAQSNPATNASLIAFTRGILTQLVSIVTNTGGIQITIPFQSSHGSIV